MFKEAKKYCEKSVSNIEKLGAESTSFFKKNKKKLIGAAIVLIVFKYLFHEED